MNSFYDYSRFSILYVDDEEKSLKYFKRAFEDKFRIYTAPSAAEGFQLLQEHRDTVGLLLTDQQMPGEKGTQLLERARQLQPRILRILVTAYSDIDAAIDAVNTGAIYKYISKPWDVSELEITLRRAMEFFIVQRERDQLLREKMSVLHNMMITDRIVSLGILAAGLSHHVRNSLVAVRTFLDLAPSKLEEEQVDMEELRNPNFWKEFYQNVQQQVEKITRMLADLGAVTEKEDPPYQDTVDLPQLLRATVQAAQPDLADRSIHIQDNLPDHLPAVVADQKKLRKCFQLLLADELANLQPNQTISITGTLLPGTPSRPEQVQLQFADDGPGLPTESLRSLFDPFFVRSNDPQEYGIRLMTCFFIIHHHGGQIVVESQQPSGTVFTIRLPTQPPPRSMMVNEDEFVSKVLLNEAMWEKILTNY